MINICKKIMWFVAVLFCFVIIGQTEVSAENYEDISSDIIHQSGADELNQDIDSNTEDFFSKNSVDIENPESVLNIDIKDIFSEIIDEIKYNIKLPLKLFSSLIAVIILSSFAGSLENTVKLQSSGKIFNLICVLVSISVISEPLTQCFYNSAENIRAGAVFMTGFIPVFSSVTVAGGGISSALSYSTLVFIASEFAVHIADSFLMPVLSMCMALSIVDAINPAVSLTALINGFKKFITRLLTFVMMIFTGLLSIQSIVGASADSLAIRTGKYLASNFVPVVGSAISDAYTTLKGSMGLLRGGVGSFGIITIIVMLLPSVISAGLYYWAMKFAYIFSDMFGEKCLSKLFFNMSAVLSIVFSIMICFAVIMIISTAIVMMTGMSTI